MVIFHCYVKLPEGIYKYVHGYKIGISTTDVNQPSDRKKKKKKSMAGKKITIVSWFTAHSNVPPPVYDS